MKQRYVGVHFWGRAFYSACSHEALGLDARTCPFIFYYQEFSLCGKNVYRSATSTNQLIWVKFFFLLLLIILLCLAAWPSTLCLKLIFEMNAENTWVKKFSLPSLWIYIYIYIMYYPFFGDSSRMLGPTRQKSFS